MNLKKFENWLNTQNLSRKKFIYPIDKLAAVFGYSGPPVIYFSFAKLFLVWWLYFGIAFSASGYLMFAYLLENLGWLFYFPPAVVGYIALGQLLVVTSLALVTSYSTKKRSEQIHLPPWESFRV